MSSFPLNPNDGDTVILTNTLFRYDAADFTWYPQRGTADNELSGGSYISDTPPINPIPGQLWWRNDPDANQFIYYFDGLTGQWVPASPAAGGGAGGGGTSDVTRAYVDQQDALRVLKSGDIMTGDLRITNPVESGPTFIELRNPTGNPTIELSTPAIGAASNIIFSYGGVGWGLSVAQNVFQIYHQTAPGVSTNPFVIGNDNSITVNGFLTISDPTGSTGLELVGSAQNSILFRAPNPASGIPQWTIDVITGQTPAINGFHIARLSPDGFTVIDDVFNILNSDGIIRAGTIRTKSGDPVDPNDLARKAYVDSVATGGGVTQVYVDQQDALRVLKSGDIITGDLTINNATNVSRLHLIDDFANNISFESTEPTVAQWIISVGEQAPGSFNLLRMSPDGINLQDMPISISNADGIITASMIRTKAGDPVDPNDLARKAYVDAQIGGGGITIGPWTNPTSYGPGCSGTLQARQIGGATGYIQLRGYVTNTTDMEPPNTFIIATLPFTISTQRYLLAPCGNGPAFPGFAITLGLDTFAQLTAYNATQQTTPMTRVWLDGVLFTP
jgi:hypothetical protein